MNMLDRRAALLGALATSGLAACAAPVRNGPAFARPAPLAALRASPDRLFDITVCLRPFRAAGPRLDTEKLGDTLVVHNYGHGGSGWSLSWGSAEIAVRKAMAGGARDIAVIGCGALGLTSAVMAQRAGCRVTIYAKELVHQTRSARATGLWTPDSRIALTTAAGPAFADSWETMARASWAHFHAWLGRPGAPVEWIDRYVCTGETMEQAGARLKAEARDTLDFAEYGRRIADLTPRSQSMPPGSTPFTTRYVRRSETLMFNIRPYAEMLMQQFLGAGGRIEQREFHAPNEIAALPQKTVIHCTGYGARALWKDDSVVPVRGQIGWLIPQPDFNYGLYYRNISVVPRRDGIVVQALEGGDMNGYGDEREVVDRAESMRAVQTLASLFPSA